ncbi:hypothetical protein F0P96_02800 [Hymenobacter busanensis]|uniref:protein-glutamate methylesterase n=1 Tax=Hymenobacter busanensis TaxID=2607656 RepID=A0A7L4ZTJ2_9BACT|nr:CheB methylesterase domain-containing protein [Hymenobacter busanensis]KAA9339561.1 hypothetical protein F0P96_02800 [Hymenobacter busanensis]QHJ06684.1 hypothetical protein GUY19_04955 [Hymenobacter busanensis]
MPASSAHFSVLLSDLPSLVRLELSKLLRDEANTHVVASSQGAEDLLVQARRHRPRLIIVGEQRLLTLEQLMSHYRAPVLVYGATPPWPGALREAARWGVYDFLTPLLPASHPNYFQHQREVVRKVRGAFAQAAPTTPALESPVSALSRRVVATPPRGIVVVGGSTGGAAAVEQLVRGLRPGLPYTVVVAVHLPAAFTASLVERLRRASALPVVAGTAGLRLHAGQVAVVPGGSNMVVKGTAATGWLLQPSSEPAASFDEPSIDLLMKSAAAAAGRHTIGVVLSGLGRDGTLGAQVVRHHGGLVVAQNEDTAAVFAMPKSVIQAGLATATLALPDIAPFLNAHALPLRNLVATRLFPVTRSIN